MGKFIIIGSLLNVILMVKYIEYLILIGFKRIIWYDVNVKVLIVIMLMYIC